MREWTKRKKSRGRESKGSGDGRKDGKDPEKSDEKVRETRELGKCASTGSFWGKKFLKGNKAERQRRDLWREFYW